MLGALAITAVMGAVFGSFLNVVAWRLPRGESLVQPRLACPGCGTPVKPYDNVPVFVVAVAARALPRLRRADLRALPAGRGPDRGALRRWSSSPRATTSRRSRSASLLVTLARADRAHRPRPPHHPQRADRGPAPSLARRARGPARPRRSCPSTSSPAPRRAASSFSPRSPTSAGWAWATSSSPRVLGLYLGRAVAPAMLHRPDPRASLVGAAIIARKGVADGRKTEVPFGPFLAFGAPRRVLRRRRDRRLATCDPSSSEARPAPAWPTASAALGRTIEAVSRLAA